MINNALINPRSIVIVGASNDIRKLGGKVLKNILSHGFKGDVYAVNPKEKEIQGIKVYSDISQLPQTDLAVLAIPSRFCPEAVKRLAYEKSTKAFIVLSGGFREESKEGAELEKELVTIINQTGGCLIGPNCIGIITPYHASVFTTPVPEIVSEGVDLISGSGGTAMFIMEAGIPKGLRFSGVYSIGNSAQIGVEDVLEYMDNTYVSGKTSYVKLLYFETISNPIKLLKHASSLIKKGCKIAAVKAGTSEAGSSAASSHSGAIACSDMAVDALLRKAGIVRCNGREELIAVALILLHKELKGKNVAIVTHAGGPAVMLTDILSDGKMEIPPLKNHPKAQALLEKLFPGSSVANPIDFLATGTGEQLAQIIDACQNDFNEIDAIVVIFGSPGLVEVYDVYDVLHEKMQTCSKPIFPILPSVINAKQEIDYFINKGHVFFPDEVIFGNALCKVSATPPPYNAEMSVMPSVNVAAIRDVINKTDEGYIEPEQLTVLLDSAKIPRIKEYICYDKKSVVDNAEKLGFPLVMKAVGPIHKTDVGGVVLNINTEKMLLNEYARLMKIPETNAVLLQNMCDGIELFIGAKREDNFGHIILCGLGGIFVEILHDVSFGLSPLNKTEALKMLKNLKAYRLIQGLRGKEGISENVFAEIIVRFSALLEAAPEIYEMDLNPLFGKGENIVVADARCNIKAKVNN